MAALQRHAYSAAAEHFRELIARFVGESALRERSLVYLALCERELSRRPQEPKTIEERLTAATAALNNGDDDRAAALARSVLAEEPNHDLALYLLAAVESRRGSPENAMRLLDQAIAVSPELRAQARHDADFENIRHSEIFRQLTENEPRIEQRRPMKGSRADR